MKRPTGRSRWAMRVLAEVRRLVARRLVRFTFNAMEEMGELALGLDEDDALLILVGLTADDAAGRICS